MSYNQYQGKAGLGDKGLSPRVLFKISNRVLGLLNHLKSVKKTSQAQALPSLCLAVANISVI